MNRTSDAAGADALRALNRAEAERHARRAFHPADRRRRIVTTAAIDVDALSEHGRRILDWLAEFDHPASDRMAEPVATTRVAAECIAPGVAVDGQPIIRSGGRRGG